MQRIKDISGLAPTLGLPFAVLLLGLTSPISAQPVLPMSEAEQRAPAYPDILAPRERSEVINRILAERLDTVIPAVMREQGIDM